MHNMTLEPKAPKAARRSDVKIEPKTLGIPIYKKTCSLLWFALGCICTAAFSIRASRLSQWLTVIFVPGPAFRLAFGGPMLIHRRENNAAQLLHGLMFILRIAFVLAVLWYILSFAFALLDGVRNA